MKYILVRKTSFLLFHKIFDQVILSLYALLSFDDLQTDLKEASPAFCPAVTTSTPTSSPTKVPTTDSPITSSPTKSPSLAPIPDPTKEPTLAPTPSQAKDVSILTYLPLFTKSSLLRRSPF